MNTCRVPDCASTSIHLRELCRSCYNYAASLVLHRITTWAQLEAAGCVGPAGKQVQSPRRPARTEWFSKAAGLSPDAMADELRRRVHDYDVGRRLSKTKRQRRKK